MSLLLPTASSRCQALHGTHICPCPFRAAESAMMRLAAALCVFVAVGDTPLGAVSIRGEGKSPTMPSHQTSRFCAAQVPRSLAVNTHLSKQVGDIVVCSSSSSSSPDKAAPVQRSRSTEIAAATVAS